MAAFEMYAQVKVLTVKNKIYQLFKNIQKGKI